MGHKKPTSTQHGIWKYKANQDDPDVKVADFSYQSDKLAEIITKAWIDENNYLQKLTNHNSDFAQKELDKAGIKLQKPVVLTEEEYNEGWQMDDDDDVVFVLPNVSRVDKEPGHTTADLLETAKMLMACVPNGI